MRVFEFSLIVLYLFFVCRFRAAAAPLSSPKWGSAQHTGMTAAIPDPTHRNLYACCKTYHPIYQ